MSFNAPLLRVFREFRRYTGDGLPNEPINAPLPVGDPQSGANNPKKSEIRGALKPFADAFDMLQQTIAILTGYASDAVSQGSVPIYGTAIGLSSLAIPDGISYIRTNGYFAADGKGAAQYRLRLAEESSQLGDQYSNSGTKRWALAEEEPTPRMFGVRGDYDTDDDAAFEQAYTYCAATRKPLRFEAGTHVGLSRSHDLPELMTVRGPGAPRINTWFNELGDKPLLRPGYKHLMSGASIILKGAATKTYVTDRTTSWQSFTYGLSHLHRAPLDWEGVGILLDVDVFTGSGQLTTAANHNKANYDVGLLLRGPLSKISRSNLFGYWNKASFVIHSQLNLEDIDSDYVRAFDTDFTSIAIIAGDTVDTQGLTGFSGVACGYYSAADHHNPSSGNYAIPSIFLDGNNGIAGIRGHRFDGNLRTRSNEAVIMDRCNDVRFDFHVVEVPTVAGVAGADAPGRFVGTSRTQDIYIGYIAQNATVGMAIDELAATIGGRLIAIGGEDNGSILVTRGGKGIRIFNDDVGDTVVQMTRDIASTTSGWMIKRDDDTQDTLAFRFDNVEKAHITRDGRIQADAGFELPSYTIAGLPPAGASPQVLVYLSNGTSGKKLAVSDGSVWRYSDGTAV